jgi:hypothetical protein
MKNENWKTLDIDALSSTNNQVVIDLKSSPTLKLSLIKEASSKGMNLGGYVRTIIEHRSDINLIPTLKSEIEKLNNRITNFETPEAKALLVNYQDKPATFYENGVKKQIIVKSIDDLFFVVLKSFKIN